MSTENVKTETQEEPKKPDFGPVELATALYILIKFVGGTVSLKREKLKSLTDPKVYIEYIKETDSYRLSCDVKRQQGKIVTPNKKVIVP